MDFQGGGPIEIRVGIVQRKKLKLQQADRQTVVCEGDELENVYDFVYLGSVFTADGVSSHDSQP